MEHMGDGILYVLLQLGTAVLNPQIQPASNDPPKNGQDMRESP